MTRSLAALLKLPDAEAYEGIAGWADWDALDGALREARVTTRGDLRLDATLFGATARNVTFGILLMARAPLDSQAAELRDQTKHLSLSGKRFGSLGPIDLASTRTFQSLLSISVEDASGIESLPTLAATRVRTLRLTRVDVSELTLELPRLRHLFLHECSHLRRVRLEDGTSFQELGVSECRTLHEVSGCDVLSRLVLDDVGLDPTGIPRSSHLTLSRLAFQTLDDVDLSATVSLELIGLSVSSLAPARHVTRLVVERLPLASLTSMSGAHSLEELEVTRCPISELGWTSSLPSLKKLRVRDCSMLTSTVSLERAPALESVELQLCTSLQTLAGLRGQQRLESIDVSGCIALRDATSLDDLPALTHLQARGTKLTPTRVPDAFHAVAHPPSKLRRRKQPAATVPSPRHAKGSARSLVARARRLLRATDIATVEQGVELVAALARLDVYEALFDGVAIEPFSSPIAIEKAWALRPNSVFHSGAKHRALREHGLRMLLVHAPAQLALRAEVATIPSLWIEARGSVDARSLLAFGSLRRLVLQNASDLDHVGALAALPNLGELVSLRATRLHGTVPSPPVQDVRGFASNPSNAHALRLVPRLSILLAPGFDISELDAACALTLGIGNAVPEERQWEGLAALPNLRHLELRNAVHYVGRGFVSGGPGGTAPEVALETICKSKTLETLKLHRVSFSRDGLVALRECRTLVRVEIDRGSIWESRIPEEVKPLVVRY